MDERYKETGGWSVEAYDAPPGIRYLVRETVRKAAGTTLEVSVVMNENPLTVSQLRALGDMLHRAAADLDAQDKGES